MIVANCNRVFLNTYHPLCINAFGRTAIINHSLLPFIDASCRREPDFENENPSISALCRASKFAPNLDVGDIVFYCTVKRNYGKYGNGHLLVAVLRVEQKFTSHSLAEIEYKHLSLPVPSNCLVPNNSPEPFDKTVGEWLKSKQRNKFNTDPINKRNQLSTNIIKSWDKHYHERAKLYPCFIRTAPLYLNLNNPIQVEFKQLFGYTPVTRGIKSLSQNETEILARQIELQLTFV